MTDKDFGGDGDAKNGIATLTESVLKDIAGDEGCKGCGLHEEGCIRNRSFHKWCDKYAWVIKRAKMYAEKTDQTWEEVLKGWESNRNYWYMNYYQECHQPELGELCRVYEDIEECRKALRGQRFECPHCKKMVSDPETCPECDWKSWGLFSSPYHVYLKKEGQVIPIFRPGNWDAVGRKRMKEIMKGDDEE